MLENFDSRRIDLLHQETEEREENLKPSGFTKHEKWTAKTEKIARTTLLNFNVKILYSYFCQVLASCQKWFLRK